MAAGLIPICIFICVRCRKIIDPQVSLVDDLNQEVAELTGY